LENPGPYCPKVEVLKPPLLALEQNLVGIDAVVLAITLYPKVGSSCVLTVEPSRAESQESKHDFWH